MPKNYDAKNMAKTGGKSHTEKKPPCPTCGGSKTIRESVRRHSQGVTPKQQYDIVTKRCPDCK